MATRLKAVDFARAKAKRDLELVVIAARERTRQLGWSWTMGKLIKDCPWVGVTAHDPRTGARLTHPVPLYLSCVQMDHEVRALERAVMEPHGSHRA